MALGTLRSGAIGEIPGPDPRPDPDLGLDLTSETCDPDLTRKICATAARVLEIVTRA